MKETAKYIRWFEEIRIEDVPLVGGKNASLGEMYRELTSEGVKIPNGFAITAEAYWYMVNSAGILDQLKRTMEGLDKADVSDLSRRGREARHLILGAGIPDDLWTEMKTAYDKLCDEYGPHTDVAVRSSATAEDLPGMSFAGQQDTYLNIVDDDALRKAVIDCWSSLWTARAIGYRARNGIEHEGVSLAVVVQEMVPSETSGVLFTANPLTGKRTETVIDATLGLGEALVSGQVEPDHYVVDTARECILDKALGAKAFAIYERAGGGTVTVAQDAGGRQALTDEEILELARLGSRVYDFPHKSPHRPPR